MLKQSALLREILKDLDPSVIEKAESVESVTKLFKEKVLEKPLHFKVGDYDVVVKALSEGKNPDLYLSCNCNYWKYQGPAFHATQKDYLYGKNKGTKQEPTTRDPKDSHKICKHVFVVLRDFFGA